MQTQKFEAFNIKDAIKKIKAELGPDAVILSTKEKVTLNDQTNQKVKMVEVIASAGVSKTSGPKPFEKEPQKVQKAVFPKVDKFGNEFQIIKSNGQTMDSNVSEKRDSPTPTLGGSFQRNVSIAKPNQPNLTQNMENVSTETQRVLQDIDKIKREILDLPSAGISDQLKEVKYLLHSIIRSKGDSGEVNQNHIINDLAVTLRTSGVLETIILGLQDSLKANTQLHDLYKLDSTSPRLQEAYLAQTIRYFFNLIRVKSEKDLRNIEKFHCLLGPTGVGKTTTIAKLASLHKIKHSKNVALVSMDTFRIAATEQLKIYSRILDCPFFEAHSTEELESLAPKFNKFDVVLLDTAGRSSKYADHSNLLHELSQIQLPIEFHLTLSASMKQRDIEENLSAYRSISLNSIIFTKLDESWAFGEILNASITSKIPLSYFSTGQKVPEDLEIASKERILERIFKL